VLAAKMDEGPVGSRYDNQKVQHYTYPTAIALIYNKWLERNRRVNQEKELPKKGPAKKIV